MLSDKDFAFIKQLLQQEAGISLGSDKRYLVESRLRKLVEELGLDSLQTLVGLLRQKRTDILSRTLDVLTTNETLFFRDRKPFEALRQYVLPELIRKRRQYARLSIWSAAASTGQEPYSIAILIKEHFPSLLKWRISILATDISPSVLEKARQGIYSQLEVNRGLPAAYLVKYFRKIGKQWQIREDVRRMVEFRELNLVGNWPPIGPFDIVFLRNVLIYFDLATKQRVLARVARVMRPDGYLFLGSAETTLQISTPFEPLPVPRSCCFRLKQASPATVGR